MESMIKKVAKEDCADLAIIMAHAYPNLNGISEESISEFAQNLINEQENETENPWYGAYRDGKLLGAIKLHEFTMNLRSVKVRLGGIAGVCVHFLHKKEKVAREMILYALEHFNANGINMAALYPFQTGFYKNMGFGYGAMKHQYRIKPEAFPQGKSKRNVEYLTTKDAKDIRTCYQNYEQTRTGMFERQETDMNGLFNFGNTVVGVKEGSNLTGYLSFRFKWVKAEYPQKYDLIVQELILTTPEALSELCTFLHSQSDQIHQIIINTQDEDFHYLFANPTNERFDSFETTALETSVTAVGVMYRVLNLKKMISELNNCTFGPITCRLKVTVRDTFIKSNGDSVIVSFNNGKAVIGEDDGAFDVEMSMGVDNFTSLLIGAVRFHTLYGYGLASLSNPVYRETIDRLFAADNKPRNETNF